MNYFPIIVAGLTIGGLYMFKHFKNNAFNRYFVAGLGGDGEIEYQSDHNSDDNEAEESSNNNNDLFDEIEKTNDIEIIEKESIIY